MDALDEPWWCNLGVQVLYVKVVFSYYLCCCVEDFHRFGSLPRGSNPSSITLIPKVKDPQGLGGFRPISLIGCIYKLLSKVLS